MFASNLMFFLNRVENAEYKNAEWKTPSGCELDPFICLEGSTQAVYIIRVNNVGSLPHGSLVSIASEETLDSKRTP